MSSAIFEFTAKSIKIKKSRCTLYYFI